MVPDEKFLGKILTPVEINELEKTPFEFLPLTLTNRGDSFLLFLYVLWRRDIFIISNIWKYKFGDLCGDQYIFK